MSTSQLIARTGLALVIALGVMTRAGAQEPMPAEPPKGPADIFNQAGHGRDQAELKRAEKTGETAAKQVAATQGTGNAQALAPGAAAAPAPTSGAPDAAPAPAGAEAGPTPAAAPDAATMANVHTALADAAMASAEPAPELPRGSIAIEVVAPTGGPYGNAEIVLGVMGGSGGRTEQRASTGADGRYTFHDLPGGTQQAYRVNVMHEGAKFSSTPFRLPDAGGYRVRIPLHGVTRDQRLVFQIVGQTVVELRDDRLHMTQQSRLSNAGESVFVLPPEGLLVPLPAGFTAFDWQEQMTDQRAEVETDKGFRLRGSIPPGSVTLAWTFDLQRSGDSAKIAVMLPFRTYSYRVISEAPEGLKLRASEFPEPERVKEEGRDLFFTQLRRSPGEPELASFTIKLDGIPGPGPGRWIAVVLALIALGWGAVRALSPSEDIDERRLVFSERKKQLLAAAVQTERELASGEIGPEYHTRKIDELTTQLALVLRDEEALG